MKCKVVLVSLFLPGIYPPGDERVVSRLLATSFLKAAAMGDPDIAAKYDVVVIDFAMGANCSSQEIADRIVAESPVAVGYSAYIWNFDILVQVMDQIKKLRPFIKNIVGGPMVSYTSVDFLEKHASADIVVCGAGEVRFNQILRSDFSDETLADIPRITFRSKENRIVHTVAPVMEDLSIIPSIYSSGIYDLNDGRKHTVFIETFRGCPFSCGYCVWGAPDQTVHKFDLENILSDIDAVYNNPNVKVVFITDSCLFYSGKRAKTIADRIGAAKYRIPTVMTLDTHILSEGVIKSLDNINIYEGMYHFGLQTTNPAALKLLRRPGGGSKERYVQKLDLLRKIKPDAKISFDVIYGLPGDDLSGFIETVNFSITVGADKIYFSPLLLLPGTDFFNERERYGIFADVDPPFMVRSTTTFGEIDMLAAVDIVLWTNLIMYFPGLFSEIRAATSKPIDIIFEIRNRVKKKIDPMREVHHEYSIEHNNKIRRMFMGAMTKEENIEILFSETSAVLEKFGGARPLDNRKTTWVNVVDHKGDGSSVQVASM